MEPSLSHLDQQGRARIVDITGKQPTQRHAVARCVVHLGSAATGSRRDEHDTDQVLDAARIVATMAGKQTAGLIPLCHPILIDKVEVECALVDSVVEIRATVESFERTGLEMEALTACAFAALALVSELGDAGRDAVVEELTVLQKSGGRSGDWHRTPSGGLHLGDPA